VLTTLALALFVTSHAFSPMAFHADELPHGVG
jgi:hypothetical protein